MLDGVAPGNDRIPLPLAPQDVASGLFAQMVGLVNQGLQHGQRVCHFVLDLTGCGKGVVSRREQLDPIRAPSDLFANLCARFLHCVNRCAREWIGRGR